MKTLIPVDIIQNSRLPLLNNLNQLDISYINCETNYMAGSSTALVPGNLLTESYLNCGWKKNPNVEYITVDSVNGNDNSGNLVNPFQTINAALQFISNFSDSGTFQLNILAGEYPPISIAAEKNFKSIIFNGIQSDSGENLVTIRGLECSRSAVFSFQNIRFTGFNQYNQSITVNTGACVNLINCSIDSEPGVIPLVVADHASCVVGGSSLSVSGSNCDGLIYVLRHGILLCSTTKPVSLNGSGVYATIVAHNGAVAEFGNQIFDGVCDGFKYSLLWCSTINVNGRGPNVFPGNDSPSPSDSTCVYG